MVETKNLPMRQHQQIEEQSNIGNYNSGDCNSGNYNNGDRNSGDYNSGDCNSGNYNSGYYNSGDFNSGDFNSGYRNSGYFNSGDRNSVKKTTHNNIILILGGNYNDNRQKEISVFHGGRAQGSS